jgi:hypothetical protein
VVGTGAIGVKPSSLGCAPPSYRIWLVGTWMKSACASLRSVVL